MPFYGGMDLSARDCQGCVIDEDLSRLVQAKVRNELPRILKLIEPFKETLQIVVESTFNGYGLVDGLQEAGYQVCLAHPLGLYMITGAKVNNGSPGRLGVGQAPESPHNSQDLQLPQRHPPNSRAPSPALPSGCSPRHRIQ
jgi:transposase